MKNSLVELHCHILPGIDDGARDLDMSMSLLRREVSDGVVGVVFTPHFHYERITVEKFVELRKAAFRQVAAAVRTEGLRVAGKLGAEVYYSTALPSLDLSKLAFADTSYILIEFPTTIQPPGIDETLFAIRAQGYTPILAHVERYPFVTEDPTLLYNWVNAGVPGADQRDRPDPRGAYQPLAAQAAGLEPCASALQRLPPPRKTPAQPAGEGFDHLPPAVARRLQKNAIEVYLGNEFRVPDPTEPKYRFGHWV